MDEPIMYMIDGFDECLLGSANIWHTDGTKSERLIYSGEKILDRLIKSGLTQEEALEYIDYNIEGAYVGGTTPVVVWEYYEEI
jgi:hypothetical protein